MTYGTVARDDAQRGVGANSGSRVAFLPRKGPGGQHVAGVHIP